MDLVSGAADDDSGGGCDGVAGEWKNMEGGTGRRTVFGRLWFFKASGPTDGKQFESSDGKARNYSN